MATLILQAAGSAIGGAIGGPLGAIVGRAAGALARVYGTARVSGQIIWATRFEEATDTERRGGKGSGPRVEMTTYSYFGNFAVGVCEGPISGIRRIWADGEELDQSQYQIRIYKGGESQGPDPLIEAKQGEGHAPAYRGLCYIVFERFPLERWGNRVPQMSCEVLRVVGALERQVRAITVIPSATEHGFDPAPVREEVGEGEDRLLNRTMTFGASDWSASMAEMVRVMPDLERSALVVAWFADDLRAGHCEIRPKVKIAARKEDEDWQVGGVDRSDADLVSRHEGFPAYGGTPSDRGVLRAIADLKARGLAVTYYPFVLMDVPAGNGRPDPYGGAEQAAFPWRGRMTLDLAETAPGTGDRTSAARRDIERFAGSAQPGDFAWKGDRLVYSGPAEWSYRRMIFHQAHLARRGGAAAFVIGSEMRGLTRLRDGDGRFPFVEALIAIATEIRAMLPDAIVTYAADWSEYACYRPVDGSGEVHFNLDPLWASDAVDVVGIDNYLPLSDWRDDGVPGEEIASPYDLGALARNLDGGEWFDWYYASEADRRSGARTPITDGAAGKPFVYRDKDLRGWWSNVHVGRGAGGMERGGPSPWVPKSKPIWFTELGCPAIDRGGNQPNVFVDPKSSESVIPYHSRGFRDDLAQRRFLEASLDGWTRRIGSDGTALNPMSPIYDGPMVDPGAIHLWTWDARPYPAFPQRSDLWTDGRNWRLGHWLNGRLANAPADALVAAILADHGIEASDTTGLDAVLDGYVIDGPRSVRDDIEAILSLVGGIAFVSDGAIRFRSLAQRVGVASIEALADGEGPLVEMRRDEAGENPDEIAIGYMDPDRAYQPAISAAATGDYRVPRKGIASYPAVLNRELADRCAARLLAESEGSSETIRFAVAPNLAHLEPGDVLSLPGRSRRWLVTRIESGQTRRIEARSLSPSGVTGASSGRDEDLRTEFPRPFVASRPAFEIMDLPLLPGHGRSGAVAIHASPWLPHAVDAGSTQGGLTRRAIAGRPALMGRSVAPLLPGPCGVFDHANALTVRLNRGSLSSIEPGALFSGGNAAAILSGDGRLEVLQFRNAEEIEQSVFRLSGLLRGQAGTETDASSPFESGARFVLLDDAVRGIDLDDSEIGQPLVVRIAPLGRGLDDKAVTGTSASVGLRAVRPYSPVHLRARFEADGAVRFSWVRRTRIGGDNWQAEEVPLGEDRELYRVRVRAASSGGLAAASIAGTVPADVASPEFVLGRMRQIEAFGTLPADLTIDVAQVSPVWGSGPALSGRVSRPVT